MADTDDLNRDVQKTKEDASNTFGQLKDDAVRVAQSAADIGRSGVEQVKTRLNDGAAAVRSQISDHTEAAKDAARDAAYRARTRGNDLLDQTKSRIEENPLQAIAIAAGVGVVLGILLRR